MKGDLLFRAVGERNLFSPCRQPFDRDNFIERFAVPGINPPMAEDLSAHFYQRG
jgi:hypothetical protein